MQQKKEYSYLKQIKKQANSPLTRAILSPLHAFLAELSLCLWGVMPPIFSCVALFKLF